MAARTHRSLSTRTQAPARRAIPPYRLTPGRGRRCGDSPAGVRSEWAGRWPAHSGCSSHVSAGLRRGDGAAVSGGIDRADTEVDVVLGQINGDRGDIADRDDVGPVGLGTVP